MISDRWNGSTHLDPNSRQVCWSHLQRDFRRHAEGLAEQKPFGEPGLELTRHVFAAWRAYQHEHHDRDHLKPRSPRSRPNYKLLQRLAEEQTHPLAPTVRQQPAQGLASALDVRQRRQRRADQQPRGTLAPRTVIHRKLSLGTQQDGEPFVERALSASVTCRLQSRSLFAYLTDLLTAHTRGDPLPALAT